MFSYARISNPILCFNTRKKPRRDITVRGATTAADFAQGRRLLRRAEALANAANDDPQGEAISLTEIYGSEEADLLLAKSSGDYAGCVALRKLEKGVAEIERLFVKPEQRGKGIGRELVSAGIKTAREKGYRSLRFVCPRALTRVLAYCRRLGFVSRPPYRLEPGVINPVYMELALEKISSA